MSDYIGINTHVRQMLETQPRDNELIERIKQTTERVKKIISPEELLDLQAAINELNHELQKRRFAL